MSPERRTELAFWFMLVMMLIVIILVTTGCDVVGDIAPNETLEPL